MTTKSANEIRSEFLNYFADKGHTKVASGSLMPANDPTLMFTNAGMVPFKDVFVGAEKRDYSRATSVQKCMRVSGKHNDLEEVGRTARHHTLFEMMGNFSFGDYFKKDAIEYAWDFLVRKMGLDADKLLITVFGGEDGVEADDEARKIWRDVSGLPDERIIGFGLKDNFWAMGDTGPCGPCTEIHYDLGGDGPVTTDDFENGRVVEIWNVVFMQFDRQKDGELLPLPKQSVDTGMGLERLVTVIAGEKSNYHTDLFMPMLDKISELVGKKYTRSDNEDDVSMRVIADHARAAAFMVADGLQPSNEGKGYVMRRIMRRGIRHGKRLGFNELFFSKITSVVVDIMGKAYPELKESAALIEKVCDLEEKTFRRTLDTGLKILGEEIQTLKSANKKIISGDSVFKLYDTYGFPWDLTEVIASENGLKIDQKGFDAAMLEQKERSRGRDVGDKAVADVYKKLKADSGEVEFVGYPHEDEDLSKREGSWRRREFDGREYLQMQTRVRTLLQDGKEITSAKEGKVEIILDPTPFYGESGGQKGDRGIVETNGETNGEINSETEKCAILITDTKKPVDGLSVCHGEIIEGEIKKDDTVWAGYDIGERLETRIHHSATHLLHEALREVLGTHVKQAGSLVDPHHLRFDYSHFESPTNEELSRAEAFVNERILAQNEVKTEVLSFDEAKKKGAMALFGEKYGDVVRVVEMGSSMEFCGGTHAASCADIGLILITREEAVAAGVRRIEAEVGEALQKRLAHFAANLALSTTILSGEVTEQQEEPILNALLKLVHTQKELALKLGIDAPNTSSLVASFSNHNLDLTAAQRLRDLWSALTHLVNARGTEAEELAARCKEIDSEGILARVAEIIRLNKDYEKQQKDAARSGFSSQGDEILEAARELNGVRLVTGRVDGADGKALREIADRLRDKAGSAVVALGGDNNGKAALLIAVTKDLTKKYHAGKLVKELAPILGGRGGGKDDMAQAGGSDPSQLETLFEKLETMI